MSLARASTVAGGRTAGATQAAKEAGFHGAPRPRAPCGPHQVWSYDFVSDHCANGQQLKCLTVTDEFTKEGLAIDVGGRIRSARVIEVPSRLVIHRHPDVPAQRQWAEEFVSKALLSWAVVLDRRARHRHGIDRARQALAEWLSR